MKITHPSADVAAILEIIAQEINNDPTARGYSGKTASQIADLLNANYDTLLPPRINTILVGVPFAPNTVDADDVNLAIV